MADETPVELLVEVGASGADAEEVDRLTRDLLRELRELPLESANLVSDGQPGHGAKSGKVGVIGQLMAGVLPTFLPNLVTFLQIWLKRGDGKTIKLKTATFEVELPAGEFSHAEIQKLIRTLGAKPTEAKPENP
ncbi:MAG TPA: hypothetical protein VGS07_22825 [Thermoanaerobaculia bacterium]|nr:hypothetical protein [Thermoanaerobaculia bacterium]